jgi:chromosome segregation ATPase
MFRNSDLTSSDKLQRVYAAGEYIEDALERFVLEVHVSEILENGREIASAVEESMSELEDVAMEYEESADNLEEYFSGSYQIDEIREKAYGIESWRDEFETAKDDLESALEELETYISQVEAYREEHDPPEDADVIVTTVEGLTDLMFDEEGNIEPFDTASIETAIETIRDQTGSCPI